MQSKASLMLKVLLNQYEKGAHQKLLNFLPEEERQKILAIDPPFKSVDPLLLSPQEKFSDVHYSWFSEKLKEKPKDFQEFILNIFSEEITEKLQKVLSIKKKEIFLSPFIYDFLTEELYSILEFKEVLPKFYFSNSPNAFLLEMDKNNLLDCITLLGIYDLAETTRKIINKNALKNLYLFLTDFQKKFLTSCLLEKEKFYGEAVSLEEWGKTFHDLQNRLQKKGLLRLGVAISQENPDFIWHIVHALDIGRGSMLEKQTQIESSKNLILALSQQVQNVIEYKKKSISND